MSAGHIRQRGQTAWELKWDAGHDVAGKRITKFKTVRGAKRDAQRELRRVLDAVEGGTFADPGKTTLAEWLDAWLTGRRHTIALKTAERYGELIAQHLKPNIGHHALSKVSTAILNAFYVDRLERGRLDGKGGLSPQTVRHMDRLLHKAFHDAIKQRLLSANPTDYVERPKVNRKPKETLDDGALAALMGKAAGDRLHAPLFVILATGVRRGELLALRWRNVDLAAAQAQIVETLEETKAGGLRTKDVKTASGRRRIDLPASAVHLLRAHQVEQKKLHLQLGLGWSSDALVFPHLPGEPWSPRNFTKAITTLAKAAGVARFSPHLGRHDHFTRLLKAGIHPKAAQVRAGHSSITVTLDVYSHATDGLQQEAAERIDTVLKAFKER